MAEAQIVGAPEDAVARLRQLIPFARLDDAALRRLAGAVEWLRADAGVRLFTVGDEPDGMYGIVTGRVRFFTETDGHVVDDGRRRAGDHVRRRRAAGRRRSLAHGGRRSGRRARACATGPLPHPDDARPRSPPGWPH